MRWWLNSNMAITTALFVIFTCIIQTSANARFELQLKNFVNNYGRDYEGNCCEGFQTSRGLCSGSCSTKFRVCLKVYQEIIDLNSECTFGEFITPVLGENQVDFTGNNLENFVNPIEFNLSSWQGTFSMIIEAIHEKSNGTSITTPVLITRMMNQSWLEIGEDWRQHQHAADHSTLTYQYRVVCQDHYYGQGCRQWCHPRDDSFGHYTCSDKGELVCLDGWKNTTQYCSEPICTPGCKEGSCNTPNTCICHAGWKGALCDECKKYPGCQHGTCNEVPWKCNCDEGWGGLLCNQDLNYCTNHRPCKNGATCHNTKPGAYSCVCPSGFSGTNCEIINDTCANSPCDNGGLCLDMGDDGFVCQCLPGFAGQFCEVSGQTCDDRPCLNGATCMDTNKGFKCLCRDGYGGPVCGKPINDCLSNPCENGGSCIDEHNGFQCNCPVGYGGDKCQINVDDCVNDPCLNGGVCIDKIGSYQCRCQPGFTGSICQTNVDECKITPCANGGICIDGNNNFTCRCRPGWQGYDCSVKAPENQSPCYSQPCQNGGLCMEAPELAYGYRCSCPSYFKGRLCNVPATGHLYTHQKEVDKHKPMAASHTALTIVLCLLVPLIVIGACLAIYCIQKRQKQDKSQEDEEARRQNEQNMAHNAHNAVNNMIFNSLDYPPKPINTDNHQYQTIQENSDFSKKAIENAYTIIPTRNNKTINTDVSRMSLASKLEKELDGVTCHRASPVDSIIASSVVSCKTPDPYINRTYSHSDVYASKRSSLHLVNNCNNIGSSNNNMNNTNVNINNSNIVDVHTSTNTLTSTCTPSTCTTPSSVYVIDEQYENYIATEV